MTVLRIPTTAEPQQFLVVLGQKEYSITLQYADVDEGGWFMTIAASNGVILAAGIPFVTGCNLLAPYGYLDVGEAGSLLFVYTDGSNDYAPPSFENLGTEGNLYYEVPDGA